MHGDNGELKVVVLCRDCESPLPTSISISSSAIVLTHRSCKTCAMPALTSNDRAQYERTIRDQAMRLAKLDNLDNELSKSALEGELREFCSWWWKRHKLERMCTAEGADPIQDVTSYLDEREKK